METSKIFEEKRRNSNPLNHANILSKLFFWWTLPTFIKGRKKDLEEEDLFKPLKSHESSRLGDKLEKAWLKEEHQHDNPNLTRPLLKIFWLELLMTGIILFFLEFVVKMVQPIIIGRLMSYYTPENTSVTKKQAYIYSGILVGLILINVLIGHLYLLYLQALGMKMRVACCSLIYRKTLRLSKSALAKTTIGQMVNLLSNDVNRLDLFVLNLHHIWLTPIQTMVIMYLLYINTGPTGLVGTGLFLVLVPVQMYISKRTSVFRLRTAIKTDERVRLMNEIISGIQVIKMYTWEKSFAKLVELARKNEMKQIQATSYLRALTMSFAMFANRLAIYFCVLAFVLTQHRPTAEYVFVVIAYYSILRFAITMSFPRGISSLAEVLVSMRRITDYLLYDEVGNVNYLKRQKNKKKPSISSLNSLLVRANSSNVGVVIRDASAKWIPNSPDNTLTNINISLSSRDLVAVVGPVGSGKSSLLNVILGELQVYSGNVEITGSISYASQEPWLFSGPVRANILFGQEMNKKKYDEVVKVCALERDFKLLPYGDRTIVGERGVTLSGGQKARINLARAIYKDADIYLLDDPLSAVDAQVGKQLFDECVFGYLRDRCVVLVTHQLQYLRTVDRIYLLEIGEIIASGTYQQLQASGKSYTKLLQDQSKEDEKDVSKASKESNKDDHDEDESPVEIKEHKSKGKVSASVYKRYFRCGGTRCMFFTVMFVIFLTQVIGTACDYFISYWVNLEEARTARELTSLNNVATKRLGVYNENRTLSDLTGMLNVTGISNVTLTSNSTALIEEMTFFEKIQDKFFTTENCIYIYSVIVVLCALVTVISSLNFYRFCMRASTHLHNSMFNKIVYAPMRFFNTNPSGRILNRFSKDMGNIDETLPVVILDTIRIGLVVLSIIFVIGSISPWIILPTIIILAIFYGFRVFYLKTSRDVKRLEGITKSPVFSHINASIQGLTTIRAFGAQQELRKGFDGHQDLHSSAFFMFLSCTRSFGMWLDLVCVLYITLVTFGFLFIGKDTYAGSVGLSITQAITLTGMFQWGMRQWSELENQMTCVERVLEYTDIEPEKDKTSREPPAHWPENGKIVFRSVNLRYAEDEPNVLKNLSFSVMPREKVGIVGRTGAGKTSLITALFRLTNIEGEIFIDNINTKDISLHDVRSKISIIPQEPVLFSGTIRKNLDPFEEYQDPDLWNALELVELKTLIYDMPAGLESNISEGGSNFSVGQRQLLCLARAIIRNNQILVLDEATANVDPRTDGLIQTTIRRQFGDCTVLTIAHRLHTVMDSDKVLVMDAGRAVEFNHPHVLLQDSRSHFHELVRQTGKSMSENLMRIAKENYDKSHLEVK